MGFKGTLLFSNSSSFPWSQVPIEKNLWISSLSSSSSNDGYSEQHNGTYSITALITDWNDGTLLQKWSVCFVLSPVIICLEFQYIWTNISLHWWYCCQRTQQVLKSNSQGFIGCLCDFFSFMNSRSWQYQKKTQYASNTLLLNITAKHFFFGCEKLSLLHPIFH